MADVTREDLLEVVRPLRDMIDNLPVTSAVGINDLDAAYMRLVGSINAAPISGPGEIAVTIAGRRQASPWNDNGLPK